MTVPIIFSSYSTLYIAACFVAPSSRHLPRYHRLPFPKSHVVPQFSTSYYDACVFRSSISSRPSELPPSYDDRFVFFVCPSAYITSQDFMSFAPNLLRLLGFSIRPYSVLYVFMVTWPAQA